MRIILVVPDTILGGISSSAVNFCNEMTRRGHSVSYLDMSNVNSCKEFLNKQVEVISLKGISKYWNLSRGDIANKPILKKVLFSILGIIKKTTVKSGFWYKLILRKCKDLQEYDVAIAFRQCAPCYSFVLNKVKAKKKIGFVHGELRFMGDISSWKRYMLQFDKIAYVSKTVKEEFITAYPELEQNACTIYNMLDINRIKQMADEPFPYSVDKTLKNIVTVSRIDNEYKRICWIPDICKKLKKQAPFDFRWYVVGDGLDFDELKKRVIELGVDDVIILTGETKNPYPAYKAADLFVLVSKSEAYPMVVIESFLLGTPLVTTRFSTVLEMMEDYKDGLIAESEQNDCVAKIIEILSNDELYSYCKAHLSKRDTSNEIQYQQFIESLGD